MIPLARRTLLASACATFVVQRARLVSAELARDDDQLGALVMGGGGRPYEPAVLDEVWTLAGGKNAHIVVVPTAHIDMDSRADAPRRIAIASSPWRDRGVKSITVRHTLNRDEADDDDFVAPFRTATGVWISGGDQSRLLETYRDTAVHRELVKLLARGGVVGGTSAGTAVMSELAIVGQRNQQTLLEPGFNLMPGVVVDQHFLARGRQRRLQRVIEQHPEFLGIGVDEHTALVVQCKSLRVVGKSSVTTYRAADDKRLVTKTYQSGDKLVR